MIEDHEHTRKRACCYPGCGKPIHDHSPVEVCRSCGMKVAREFEHDLYLWRRDQQAKRIEKAETKRGNREGGLVYYVQIANHIKIGYTTKLRQRLQTLRVDPFALLAIELGSPDLERVRHRDFAACRIGRREDFELTPELQAHITRMRAAYGVPSWAILPNTSVVTRTRVLD